MNIERFEQLVITAVESLPDELHDRLENITIVVEDHPTRTQLSKKEIKSGYTLLGLYEGIPITERTYGYGMVPPDKITIFKKPIESQCGNDEEITIEIKRVVQHEIAHHFGIDDARLEEIEKAKYSRRKQTG